MLLREWQRIGWERLHGWHAEAAFTLKDVKSAGVLLRAPAPNLIWSDHGKTCRIL